MCMNAMDQLMDEVKNQNKLQLENSLQVAADTKYECRQLMAVNRQECMEIVSRALEQHSQECRDVVSHALSRHSQQNREMMTKLADDAKSYATKQTEDVLQRTSRQADRIDELLLHTAQQSEKILGAVRDLQRRVDSVQVQSRVTAEPVLCETNLVKQQQFSEVERKLPVEQTVLPTNSKSVQSMMPLIQPVFSRPTGSSVYSKHGAVASGQNVDSAAVSNPHNDTSLWDAPITPVLSRPSSSTSLPRSFNTARSVPSVHGSVPVSGKKSRS